MSSLPPDKTSEFTASDILSADAWNGRTSRPVLGLDVACTKIAVDFQNMRRPGVEETIRRNLELLREATSSDCAFAAVFGLEEPIAIEDIQVARSAFAQCRPEALRGETMDRFPWLRARSEHLRLSELRDTSAPRREQIAEASRFSELQIGSRKARFFARLTDVKSPSGEVRNASINPGGPSGGMEWTTREPGRTRPRKSRTSRTSTSRSARRRGSRVVAVTQ